MKLLGKLADMACRTIPFCISMPSEVYSLERTHYVEINANIFLYLFHVYRKGCFHYIKKGCFLYKSQFPHKSISIFKFNITLLCWNGKGRNGDLLWYEQVCFLLLLFYLSALPDRWQRNGWESKKKRFQDYYWF